MDHRRVQIQAFQRESDLLPIHIGSSSNIELAQVTKKRVLQRVLRYYGGSTGPRCANYDTLKQTNKDAESEVDAVGVGCVAEDGRGVADEAVD